MGVRHFLNIADYSAVEIGELLDLAHDIKIHKDAYRGALACQTLAMIFQKRSTRTRVSFEVGMFELGGHALFLSSQDIQIGRGETIADTAAVLGRYCDGIMARVYAHSDIVGLAEHAGVPVINGLSDASHPCQVMCDLQTLVEHFTPGGFAGKGFDRAVLIGKKFTYVGDGNNMAHSIIEGAVRVGMHVAIAAPKGYEPDAGVVAAAREAAEEFGHGVVPRVEITNNPSEAAAGAHCIYTDVWASMGQEAEADKRKRDFAGFIVDEALMARADPSAVFMHCLPAHRGEEVSAGVIDGPQSIVFDEAENRLHVQKAILVRLMGRR